MKSEIESLLKQSLEYLENNKNDDDIIQDQLDFAYFYLNDALTVLKNKIVNNDILESSISLYEELLNLNTDDTDSIQNFIETTSSINNDIVNLKNFSKSLSI